MLAALSPRCKSDLGDRYSLPFVFQVHAPSDLGNEGCSHIFGSDGFVHTEEINLTHFYLVFFFDVHMYWYAGNRSYQFIILLVPDSNQPFGLIPRGC